MSRQFQLDNTASPSNEWAYSFTERVAAHHDVVDTVDAFGAFGAFDASFDEDTEDRFFELLFDAGSRPSNIDDVSANNNATNNGNMTGRRVTGAPLSDVHWTKPIVSSHNTPSWSMSRTLPQNALPSSHLFNSPVESCYWANLGLTSHARVPSPQTAVEDRDAHTSSSSSIAEPDPFLVRSDLTLGGLQVAENPFSALPLLSAEDLQDDEIVVSDEEVQLSPSPLTVSNSSESTRADTPFRRTPSVEPCEASDAVPHHVEAAKSSAGASASPNGLPEGDFLLDKKTSLLECVADAALSEKEVSPAADVEVGTAELTPGTSSLARQITVAEPEEAASAPNQEPVVLELAPNAPPPSLSGATSAQEPHVLPASQDASPSRKRKRVAKTHAAHELRALSTLPPERKTFSLPAREGRASKTGINKIRNMQLEAESCCHLAGDYGFCQFRDLADGGRKCMVELPKDDKVARAHLAMHTDALGWREYSRQHPDWKPTCPWCNEPRTKFEQLTRHILDTHLLMFMEWCPCGGTNSRSNHKPNTVRHVDSDVHKVWVRQQAVLRTVKLEDADDGQEEFVQGSSKGIKRRRRG
ncbi:hypothetical protein ACEPAI_6635 [Sanghuangporus weigelae]